MSLLRRIEEAKREAAKEAVKKAHAEARRLVEGNPARTGLDATIERELAERGLGEIREDGKFYLKTGSSGEQKG